MQHLQTTLPAEFGNQRQVQARAVLLDDTEAGVLQLAPHGTRRHQVDVTGLQHGLPVDLAHKLDDAWQERDLCRQLERAIALWRRRHQDAARLKQTSYALQRDAGVPNMLDHFYTQDGIETGRRQRRGAYVVAH